MNNKIKSLIDTIKYKKEQLDKFAPLPPDMAKNMGDWLRIELTYTSNAIEWNTLTRQETALVVEEGITPAGKSVVEILEAQNHNKALTFIMELAKQRTIAEVSQNDILDIHRIILTSIQTENAGVYRSQNVRITWSETILPNYMKVPDHMNELENWLHNTNDSLLMVACDLHYKFVRIHPFIDWNGRTWRLLFNLILLIGWYPLAFIETKERGKYISSLEVFDNHKDTFPYYEIMLKSVERSLDLYLDQLQDTEQVKVLSEELFKIGELGKMVWESISTIRYWTSLWLLPVIHKWSKNYSYYDSRAIALCKKIRQLQETKRYSLEEIKKLLGV